MIKNIIILLLLIVAICQTAKSNDFVVVDSLYIEAEKNFGSNRNYHLPKDSEPNYNLNLGFELSDASSFIYSSYKISSTVDQSQFRQIGLDTEFGLNVPRLFQVYIRHYSGHELDAVNPSTRFPQENVFGVRLKLIGR